jgi:hypothetical protein
MNLEQAWAFIREEGQSKVKDRIRWESNSLVKLHPRIPIDSIIAKTSTSEFPAELCTVRFHRVKDRLVTLYFNGALKTTTGHGGYRFTRKEGCLRATLPYKGRWGDCDYELQGTLSSSWSLDEMVWALDYVWDIVDEMS